MNVLPAKIPTQKLPARSDIVDAMCKSVQRLSMLWDSCAISPGESRTRKETLRSLTSILDELDAHLEALTDRRILEVWRLSERPERSDTDTIVLELATIIRQTSSLLSLMQGIPPRGRAK